MAAPSPTEEVDGRWSFSVESESSTPGPACRVVVHGGEFDIRCSGIRDPATLGESCVQTIADERFYGTLDEQALSGAVDDVDRFEGEGCASFGRTSGVDVTDTMRATLSAVRTRTDDADGFWGRMNGLWQYQVRYPGTPFSLECGVAFDAGAFELDCPIGLPQSVATYVNCTQRFFVKAEGLLDEAALSGNATLERRLEGSCGPLALLTVEGTYVLSAVRVR